MSPVPFISLGVAIMFAFLTWRRRNEFTVKPYFHWFIYLHLAAVGLHQFEEYGWPGGFRDAFVSVFGAFLAEAIVPSATVLELANAFGFMIAFGLIGWLGTRVIWVGMALLFVNFGNAFFHLVHSVVNMVYVPGVVTGTLLYMPLGLFAVRFAVRRDDITGAKLLLAFAAGTAASLLPFIHVWIAYGVGL